MIDYSYTEAMLKQLARDRDAYVIRQARLAALEGEGPRAAMVRGRAQRERIARLLKALATMIAPAPAPEMRRTAQAGPLGP